MTPADLRLWRWKHGLTQGQLATILGVTWLTVNRWENGHRGVPKFLDLALETVDRRRAELLDGTTPQ